MLRQPDLGLWFLWALFFINIIFLLCRKLAKSIRANEVFVVIAVGIALNLTELLTGYRDFGYHWISWYFVFFSIGIYWRTYLPLLERPCVDKTLRVASFVAFPVLMVFFRMHNQPPLFYQWIDLGRYFPVVYRMLTNVMGVVFFYELFKHHVHVKERNLLCRIGTKTLAIYYLHFYILRIFFKIDILGDKTISVMLITICTLAICYQLAIWCKRFKITRLLILGEDIFRPMV